jgi:uncharacterized protein (TIGR02118 family)
MKMVCMFKRKAGLTPEQFREHYEERHAPMAVKLFPFFKDYRRSYIRHDLAHKRADGEPATRLDFDVITEIWFASQADYERMARLMTEPAIRQQVIDDEMRFIDRSATLVMLVEEERSPQMLAPQGELSRSD